jgi:hypothetical protein
VREGTFGWRQLEVTSDVPAEAGAIAFGVRLRGRGAVHVADVQFGAVGDDLPAAAQPGLQR